MYSNMEIFRYISHLIVEIFSFQIKENIKQRYLLCGNLFFLHDTYKKNLNVNILHLQDKPHNRGVVSAVVIYHMEDMKDFGICS